MKDIYEVFNNIDINEEEFQEIPADEVEVEAVRKRVKSLLNKKRLINIKRASIAAAIIVICVFSIISVNPALATSIPVVNRLFKNNLVGINSKYMDYLQAIGKIKSCEGIDVTFESAVADSNELCLNFIIRNNNRPIKEEDTDIYLSPTAVKVNGERINAGSGATSELIDTHTVRVLQKIDWSKYKIDNRMNVDINIDKLFGKSGDWGVSFYIDKSQITDKTFNKEIDTKLDINGVKGKISTVVASPLTIAIKGEGKFNSSEGANLSFLIFDDKGRALHWEGSSSGTSGFFGKYEWNSMFISNSDMKSIKVIPVYSIKTGIHNKRLPAVKVDFNIVSPIELPIDKDKSINIKDYCLDGDYLIVKYNEMYFGQEALPQLFDNLIYVNADGKEVSEGKDDKRLSELYKKYLNPNCTIRIFEVGKCRNIMVGTYDGSNVKIMKDKAFTVSMKK
ncbi:MAG: DUF4179 domain-containing protein [Bacillota bacterium]|nr:DUF4179 domain-containing protein [Bacillota bacterium]